MAQNTIFASTDKSMQYVLLEAQEATEQCVNCCLLEAPPGAGRVDQFGKHDGSVDSLQRLVVHAVAAQNSDDVQ